MTVSIISRSKLAFVFLAVSLVPTLPGSPYVDGGLREKKLTGGQPHVSRQTATDAPSVIQVQGKIHDAPERDGRRLSAVHDTPLHGSRLHGGRGGGTASVERSLAASSQDPSPDNLPHSSSSSSSSSGAGSASGSMHAHLTQGYSGHRRILTRPLAHLSLNAEGEGGEEGKTVPQYNGYPLMYITSAFLGECPLDGRRGGRDLEGRMKSP